MEEDGRVVVSLAEVEAYECYKMTPVCHFRLGSWVQKAGEGGEGGRDGENLVSFPPPMKRLSFQLESVHQLLSRSRSL